MANEDYNIKRTLPPVSGAYRVTNPTVGNVERAYRRIRTQGDYLQAWADAIPGFRYTANHRNKLGLGNHFQGIQRLRRGQYFVVSGGDPHKGEGFGPGSHVFVVKMGSRGAAGPWGSNILTESRPRANPKRDKIARIIGVDRTLWHAGGMAILYRRIRTQGDYLQAWADAIPGFRYTANHRNKLGLGNHFQGIQRLRRGQYFVVSGGDPHKGEGFGPGSHVFVVKMGSRGAAGPWGSNILTESRPRASPKRDKIARIIGVDRTLWHAGGMAVVGDILAVPVETSSPRGKSKVVFFNMADPEKPQRFTHEVVRSRGKAGAVCMTRLENDYYLLAVWSDSDKNPKRPRRLDFYLSRSTKFDQGFHRTPVTWQATSVKAADGQDRNFSNFQTVNFINQRDGRLFLIGLHNTSEAAPTKPGRDYADLYSVRLPSSLTRATPTLGKPTITKLAKRQFFCNDQQANMDAAAGTYIGPNGGLNVYAAWHWRSDDLMRLLPSRGLERQ